MRNFAATGIAVGILAAVSGGALAGADLVHYPTNYRSEFTNYMRVDRPDRKTVRFFYVNPAALEAAEPGAPLPHGTVLIMEDHKAKLDTAGEEPERDALGRMVPTDEVTNVFVMEKQPGWGAAYPPEKRNGEWEYAWFLPDGSRRPDAKFDGCFGCHMSRAGDGRDFTFTFAKYVMDTKR